jgi:cell division protein FtsB
MRWLIAVLVVLLLGLQYRLWIGEGSYAQRADLTRQLEQQKIRNARLEERNRILAEEVRALKSGTEAIEERARTDLGMVAEGETFYLVLEERNKRTASTSNPDQEKELHQSQPSQEIHHSPAQDMP